MCSHNALSRVNIEENVDHTITKLIYIICNEWKQFLLPITQF